MGRDDIVSPRLAEALIADGGIIVVFEEFVLRLDSWIDKHPGGRLAVLHMVGKDATDEIMAYHSDATIKTMGAYRMGRKPLGPWTNMTPPVRGGIYRPLDPADTTCCTTTQAGSLASYHGSHPIDDIATDQGVASGRDTADATAEQKSPVTPPRQRVSALGPTSRTGPWLGSSPCGRPVAAADLDSGYEGSEGDSSSSKAGSAVDEQENPPRGPHMCPTAYTDWAVQQNFDQCLRDYPSIEPAVQHDIVRRYRLLHQQVRDEGLYECRYGEYAKEMVRYVTLFAIFLFTLRHGWYMTSAVFLGLFWHQIMFTAHDAGHRAITHNYVVDTLVGLFVADFCCGLSIGWWKSSHNVHHLVTNHPNHDPDIQNVPLFATCPSFFRSNHSSYYNFSMVWDAVANFMVPYQMYTYYPVMGIARFNLYILSWLHMLSSKSAAPRGSKAWWVRPTEIAFMSCYWFLFGYCLLWRTLPTWTIRVCFVLVSHVITMPLHVQITLSHWGMSTSDLGETESFAQRQLRTTMDVDCPAWLDFIHGGLQFQTVHHLFPRVPRHNLRRAQELAMGFSKDTGIPYSILAFVDGNRKVVGRLGEIGEQVKILISCQKYMAETGESGLH